MHHTPLHELPGMYMCDGNPALIADRRQFLLGAILTLICFVIFKNANYFYEMKEKGCTKQLPAFRPD